MKITVIGATGRTGRLVVREGVRRGHEVTAFARRRGDLDRIAGLAAVVVGDGRRAQDLAAAVRGRDAVISVVGAAGRGPTSEVSEVTSAVIAAMRAAGARRLVVVSANGLVATHPRVLAGVVRWVFRGPYADLAAAERAVAASGLDWTIVRPTRLTDGPATGRVRRVRGELTSGPYQIGRADLAAALLDLATSADDIGGAVEVTGGRPAAAAGAT